MVSTGSNGGEKNLLFIEYLKLMPIISKIKKDWLVNFVIVGIDQIIDDLPTI